MLALHPRAPFPSILFSLTSQHPPHATDGATHHELLNPSLVATECVSDTPARVSNTPARVSNTPARVSNTPPPVSNIPAQVSNTPARVSNTPARVSNTPARVSNTPARVSQHTCASVPTHLRECPTHLRKCPTPLHPRAGSGARRRALSSPPQQERARHILLKPHWPRKPPRIL